MTINKEVLKNLEQLPGLLSESEDVETAKKELIELAKEATSTWGEASNFLAEFAEGKELSFSPDKEELFKDVQAESLNIFGDWNEEAANFALAAYLSNEGTFTKKNDPEAKPNLEELFPLSEGKVDFELEATNKEVNALALEDFAGENKTFPIKNLAAALKLKETANTPDLSAKLKEFGVEGDAIVVAYLPGTDFKVVTTSELTKESSVEDLMGSLYLSAEQWEAAKAFVNEIASYESTNKITLTEGAKPVELDVESTVKYLMNYQETNKDVLATLVGITRKLGITKEQLEEATEAYKVFSKPVLEKLLDKIPSKKEEKPSISNEEEEIDPSISKEESSIKVENDSLAAPGLSNTPKNESKPEKTPSWKTGLTFKTKAASKLGDK